MKDSKTGSVSSISDPHIPKYRSNCTSKSRNGKIEQLRMCSGNICSSLNVWLETLSHALLKPRAAEHCCMREECAKQVTSADL